MATSVQYQHISWLESSRFSVCKYRFIGGCAFDKRAISQRPRRSGLRNDGTNFSILGIRIVFLFSHQILVLFRFVYAGVAGVAAACTGTGAVCYRNVRFLIASLQHAFVAQQEHRHQNAISAAEEYLFFNAVSAVCRLTWH